MKHSIITIGRTSEINEDVCCFEDLGGIHVACVADGMGGLYLGAEASKAVCRAITSYIKDNLTNHPIKELLHKALEYADDVLTETSKSMRCSMGTAVTVVLLDECAYHVVWQGNVRLYKKHKGMLSQLTTDHIKYVGYGRTCLTRCIKGCGLREDIPYLAAPFVESDSLYLCSDGFYTECSEQLQYNSIDEMSLPSEPKDDLSLILISK